MGVSAEVALPCGASCRSTFLLATSDPASAITAISRRASLRVSVAASARLRSLARPLYKVTQVTLQACGEDLIGDNGAHVDDRKQFAGPRPLERPIRCATTTDRKRPTPISSCGTHPPAGNGPRQARYTRPNPGQPPAAQASLLEPDIRLLGARYLALPIGTPLAGETMDAPVERDRRKVPSLSRVPFPVQTGKKRRARVREPPGRDEARECEDGGPGAAACNESRRAPSAVKQRVHRKDCVVD